jgi:Usg-like family
MTRSDPGPNRRGNTVGGAGQYFVEPIERFHFWRENHALLFQVGLEVGMVEKDEISKDFRKQVLGYGLTTAEIVYRRPDRHGLLQTYVWQDYDLFPNFPALKDFLA